MGITATLAAAAATAGAGIYSASKQADAAKSAGQQTSDAAKYAADLQHQQYLQSLGLMLPGYRVGQGALGLYSTLLGLPGFALQANGGTPSFLSNGGMSGGVYSVPAGSLGGGGYAGGAGQPDYSAYLAANPDLAAEAQRVTANGQFPSVAAYLQWHDANYPSEGRPSYVSPAAQGGITTGGVTGGSLQDQNGALLQSLTGSSSFDPYSFVRNLPGYQDQLKQGLDSVQGSAAARGSLRSGATLKALDTYGQQTFGNYFDKYMGQLGTLAGLGPSTANSISSAGQQAATNQGSLAITGANAIGQGNVNAANAWSSGLGGALGSLNGALSGIGSGGGGWIPNIWGGPSGQSSYDITV